MELQVAGRAIVEENIGPWKKKNLLNCVQSITCEEKLRRAGSKGANARPSTPCEFYKAQEPQISAQLQ